VKGIPEADHGEVIITAHRGMGVRDKNRAELLQTSDDTRVMFYPENSIEAFKEAIRLGADALECDINTSKDGAAMVIHGGTLSIYTTSQKTMLEEEAKYKSNDREIEDIRSKKEEFIGKCNQVIVGDQASVPEGTDKEFILKYINRKRGREKKSGKDLDLSKIIPETVFKDYIKDRKTQHNNSIGELASLENNSKIDDFSAAILQAHFSLVAHEDGEKERGEPTISYKLQQNQDRYQIPTLTQLLELAKEANLERTTPLKLNIELKGERSGISSLNAIREFYKKDPLNIGLVPPESLVFLGTRNIGEIAIVNALLHGGHESKEAFEIAVKKELMEHYIKSNAIFLCEDIGAYNDREEIPGLSLSRENPSMFLNFINYIDDKRHIKPDKKWSGIETRIDKTLNQVSPGDIEEFPAMLQKAKTNLMISTAEAYGTEALTDTGDFGLKPETVGTCNRIQQTIYEAIVVNKYEGIDISFADIDDRLADTISSSYNLRRHASHESKFIIGLTASNWKATEQEGSRITPEAAMWRVHDIADRLGIPVLIKVDEPEIFGNISRNISQFKETYQCKGFEVIREEIAPLSEIELAVEAERYSNIQHDTLIPLERKRAESLSPDSITLGICTVKPPRGMGTPMPDMGTPMQNMFGAKKSAAVAVASSAKPKYYSDIHEEEKEAAFSKGMNLENAGLLIEKTGSYTSVEASKKSTAIDNSSSLQSGAEMAIGTNFKGVLEQQVKEMEKRHGVSGIYNPNKETLR